MNLWQDFHQDADIFIHYDEVICISNVIFLFETMFHELVKLVHVDIDQHLGSQISKR